MGQGADPQVIKQFGLYQDKELQLYVNEIGQKMVSNLTNPEFHNYFLKWWIRLRSTPLPCREATSM